MTNAILRGKPDAGNPHVRFDEGEVASAKPRRGSLLYRMALRFPAFLAFASVALGGAAADYGDDLLDRCWLWGHETGQVDGAENKWGLDVPESYYHMADAAKDMGLYNLNVIRWDLPDRKFRDSLRRLKRLTWPASAHPAEKHSTYRELGDYDFLVADEMPNVVGFELDDYFQATKTNLLFAETSAGRVPTCPAVYSYEDLKALRTRVLSYPRELELRLVVYDELFSQRKDPRDLKPTIDLADTVTYWVWRAKNLPRMEEAFRQYRELAPGKSTFLGIYLWDFGDHREMPLELMKLQLEKGLAMWRGKEIEGFVFLCSSICNRHLPAVDYARRWIREHGAERR